MLCAPSCQNTQALIFIFASKWQFDARAERSRSSSLVSGQVFVVVVFFSSCRSVFALDKFHAACKQQGLDFSECLRGKVGSGLHEEGPHRGGYRTPMAAAALLGSSVQPKFLILKWLNWLCWWTLTFCIWCAAPSAVHRVPLPPFTHCKRTVR